MFSDNILRPTAADVDALNEATVSGNYNRLCQVFVDPATIRSRQTMRIAKTKSRRSTVVWSGSQEEDLVTDSNRMAHPLDQNEKQYSAFVSACSIVDTSSEHDWVVRLRVRYLNEESWLS